MRLARTRTSMVPLLCSFAVACGDDARQNDDIGTETLPMTSVSLSNGATSEDTTAADSLDTTPDSTGTGGTGEGGECEGIQCGVECCGSDEECVLQQCMPICDSGVRCGDDLGVCCGHGQVCLQPDCITPGDPCIDSYDCPVNQFCEPTLGACLPQQMPVVCEVYPDFEDVQVQLKWSFEEEESIAAPLVADVDGDGVPEVILNTTNHQGGGFLAGTIVILDGETGAVQTHVLHDPGSGSYGSYGRSTPGIADVDGDGLPDIVYSGRPLVGSGIPSNWSIIYAVNGIGEPLWTHAGGQGSFSGTAQNPQPHYIEVWNGAPAFGNFDADDASEVVFGATLIDNDGRVVWDEEGEGGTYGVNDGYRGGVSAIVDLTGDGYPEIISGQHAWQVDWNQPQLGPPQVTVTMLWDAGGPDGYPAVADLDGNGTPEVVLVGRVTGQQAGIVRILDGATGQLWCGIDPTGAACAGNDALRTQPIAIPGGGRGGPPTIADFDDDGRPEIGLPGGSFYTVYDIYREGEDVVVAEGFPAPSLGDIYVRWTQPVRDESSNATGSSVFDFQGDGISEVLYQDECHFRIYEGATGNVVLEIENSSATIHEYPIVADVDGDGRSNILVVANEHNTIVQDRCGQLPGYTFRSGLFVYEDPDNQWVRTRRVWNMHTYHVTNSDSRGAVPPTLVNNWEQEGLNNFRQNVQGVGIFNAPDLTADLSVNLLSCVNQEFEVVATVRNEGSLGVPAGIPVSLYEGTDATGTLIGTETTLAPLLPGAFVNFTWFVPAVLGQSTSFYVVIDDDGIAECNDENNDAATDPVACPIAG
jgi:hypothetical protein